ncbi:MAG: M13 family metallopeptidase [Hyphomonadaceae bacterium]
MRIRLLLSAAALLFAASCASKPAVEAPPPAAKAAIGAWGYDMAAQDAAVKPGDDFFRFTTGGWMKTAQIPPDRTRWGAFDELRAQAEADVKEIVLAMAARRAAAGSNEQKIGDFYNAFMDTAAIEQKGLAPAQADLDAIAALKTHDSVAALIATPGMPLDGPLGAEVTLDEKNPDRYIVGVSHAGLSLPDREYYLKKEGDFAEIRAKFEAHAARMLALAGHKNAKAEAKQILALETAIARLHWPIAKRRERELTYNLVSVSELKRKAPAYPWAASFKASGFEGQSEVVVAEWSAVPGLAKLFRATPVSTWRAYLTYHYLANEAAVLPKAFDDEAFDFYGRTLNGQPEQRERWKRAVSALNGALGEAVGALYVAKHFPPDAKAKMDVLVENLRKAYGARIAAAPWMSADTKQAALEKLASFRPKIGYPVAWRDYTALEIVAGDAFGNQKRAAVFEWNRDVARLGKPTDRDEWFMTPQTVNAYYNPVFNEIVFPAAILQPPFFDPNADPAVNYGGIGGVIGHEMGHGFDDQGAKSDAKGVLRTWWKKADEDAFKARVAKLATQYDAFEPLKGLRINGQLTLGENIGDLGGLSIAHDAYLLSLNGAPAPAIGGVSADQRFFYGWGQVWRSLIRDPALRNQILSDPHSPAEFRVNGVVRNIDAWYAAFGVQPGDKLYLAPEERVKIW